MPIDLFATEYLTRWERLAPQSLEQLAHQDPGGLAATIKIAHHSFHTQPDVRTSRSGVAEFIESSVKARFSPENGSYGLSEEAATIVAELPAELMSEA